MYRVLVLSFFLISCLVAEDKKENGWSKAVNGLQARVVLKEGKRVNSHLKLDPYLELKNVSNEGMSMKVNVNDRYVRFELLDKDGELIPAKDTRFSGVEYELEQLLLPYKSQLQFFAGKGGFAYSASSKASVVIECSGGPWVLTEKDNGQVFLRMTLKDVSKDGYDDYRRMTKHIWHGEIVTPAVKVEWGGKN